MIVKMETHWSSDWNGDEVGYPDVPVVGLYTLVVNPDIHFYIDMDNGEVLESWYVNEDCECLI